ncbi:MAG: ATP-binding protein, partial [Pseudomonadota bacterium]
RYRLLAEHASDVIARVTADGRVRYVSPAIAALLGIDPVVVVGSRLQTFIHPADRDRVGARLASPGEGGAISFRMSQMDGGHVWVEASTHGLGGDDGDVVAIIRDVTRRKAAEDALAAKTIDLERSNAELEQFAYVASHDLREPLRMVANYLQLIDRKLGDGKDEDLTDFLGFAIDGAKRMDRLILDLLEFSRVGRNRPEFEPVDLAEVLYAAAQPFRDKIADGGGRLELPEAAPAVNGDRQELARLFQNLIGNAVKYVPPDRAPEVVVSVAVEPDGVVVSVADNGIGIAADHRERVFQIFQRLHSRDKYEGTGVGLAICRKIVDLHGGRIWIEANGNEGSVFRVALPSAEAQSTN